MSGNAQQVEAASGGLFQQVLTALYAFFGLGQKKVGVDTLKLVAGGAFQRMYGGSFQVYSALIENVSASTTDVITIVSSATPNPTASQGKVLNPPSASGQAGGNIALDNVDLGQLAWTGTTTGDLISVTWER
jgi:hypothetical protein